VKRSASIFLWLGTFLSAILLTPELPYVGTKLVLADVFFVLAIYTLALQVLRDRALAWDIGRPQRMIFLLFGTMFVASFVTYAYISIPEGTGSSGGMIAMANYLYGFLIMITCIFWLRTLDDAESLASAILCGGLLLSAVATIALTTGGPAWAFSGYRVSATMNETNQVQSYVAPCMCLATTYVISARSKRWLKILAVSILLLGSVALIATGSRSSAIFLLMILLFFALRVVFSRATPVWLKVVTFGGSFGAGVAAIAFASFVATYGPTALPDGPIRVAARPVDEFMKMERQDDLLQAMGPRGTQIAIVQQNWYKSPVFGFGPDAFKDRFNYHLEVHNTYLGLLIQHGLLGLACILGVLGIIAYVLVKRIIGERDWEKRQFLIGLLAALAVLYLYGMFTFGLRQRIFWVVLGLATASMRPSRQRHAPPALTTYRGAAI
jgi:O-antigen ligase